MTEQERFWSKLYKEPGENACYLWEGSRMKAGYGEFTLWRPPQKQQVVYAHRYAYELIVGPIPAGLTLDHLCRVRSCVNPAHLEPVTRAENNLRGVSPIADNARKTYCINGHPFVGENLKILSNGGRDCKTCQQKRWRIKGEKRKEKRVQNQRTVCINGHPLETLYSLLPGPKPCKICRQNKAEHVNQQRRERYIEKERLKKTVCPQGHLYTPETTYYTPGTKYRQCVTCRHERTRLSNQRRKEKRNAA